MNIEVKQHKNHHLTLRISIIFTKRTIYSEVSNFTVNSFNITVNYPYSKIVNFQGKQRGTDHFVGVSQTKDYPKTNQGKT